MVSKRVPANILLACLGALAVFHVLVLLGVVPDEMVWGGRATGPDANLFVLESVALVVTFLFAGIVAAKAEYFGPAMTGKLVTVAMWFVFGYFTFGILANLMSSSSLERLIFTPVNLILAILSLRLSMSK